MIKPVYIYGLINPLTNKICYIGKTSQTVSKRVFQHITKNSKYSLFRYFWRKSIVPDYTILETARPSNWVDRERYWIAKYRNQIINIHSGGHAILNYAPVKIKESMNQLVVKSNNDITLTEEQQLAHDAIIEFIKSPMNDREKTFTTTSGTQMREKENTFYTLKGYAGTGKTTLVGVLIHSIRRLGKTVGLTAPTHKAKKVLGSKTKVETMTIHKVLGIKLNTDIENFDINNPNFDPMNPPLVDAFNVLIVDEASMLNTDLLQLLKELVIENDVKVLLIGDPAQLPPVNETISKAFKIRQFSELTSIVRTNDNSIIDLCTHIRNNLDKSKINLDKFVSTNIKKCANGSVLQMKAIEAFDNVVNKGYDLDHCKLLTFTNKSVSALNDKIRSKIIKHSDRLIVGDVLMSYKTVSIGEELWIRNSEDYVVMAIDQTESSYGVACLELTLKASDNSMSKVQVVEDYQSFYDKWNDAIYKAKTNKAYWRAYYEFKDEHLLFKDMKDKNNNFLCGKDLDYGYALTIHKSQGSTYENTFINTLNIDTCKNVTQRNKLKYVAFSRASNKIYFV